MASQGVSDRARELVSRILREARAHDYAALIQIDADPETEGLLGALPEDAIRQAQAHLRGARVWRAEQIEKASRKLEAAQKALEELDFSLARGILRKIDGSFLDDAGQERRDQILLSVEARALELKEIEERVSGQVEASETRSKKFRKR